MSGFCKVVPIVGALAAILYAAAVPSAALAQAAAEWAQQGRNCMALRTLQIEEHLRLKEEWVRRTRQAIDAGEHEACRDLYEKAVQALGAEEADDGNVVRSDGEDPLLRLR